MPYIQFYDSITNLKLQTKDDCLHVHVSEIISKGTIDIFSDPLGHPGNPFLGASGSLLREALLLLNKPRRRLDYGLKNAGSTARSTVRVAGSGEQRPRFKTREIDLEAKLNPIPRERDSVIKTKRGLHGFVNGQRSSAIADTGAGHNIISKAYARELKLPISPPAVSFQIGNSAHVKSAGKLLEILWAYEPLI